MKLTKLARLKSVGGTDGDWAEGSVFAPPDIGFVYSGRGARVHLRQYGERPTHSFQALCGVGVTANLGNEETLIANVEQNLCTKCLRVLEQKEMQ